MHEYTVKQLAELAGITVRTLHHYDRIGLLKPGGRTGAGYRLYGEQELLRLQQILFYRELEFPLDEIGAILDAPDFDPVVALHEHRQRLEARAERLQGLLNTIDVTIAHYGGEQEMKNERDLYEGFPKETAERYRRESRELYGEAKVEAVEQRLKKLDDREWKAVKQEGEDIARLLAELMDHTPDSDAVQKIVAQHHAWIENFYPAPADLYEGLGRMYVDNPEFRAFYDRHREGLATFLRDAMVHYAATVLR